MTTEATQSEEILNDGEETVEDQGSVVSNTGETVDVETYDEKKEEAGERPEWLPEKFKTPEDLAKSYQELQKTLHEKGKTAPESYELPEDLEINTEDESYAAFVEKAKQSNLTNDQFLSVIGFAKESGLLGEPQDFDKELQELGGEDSPVIKDLRNFAQSKLNAEEQDALNELATTARATKLLHKLIKASNQKIPAKVDNVSTEKEMEKELDSILAKSNRTAEEKRRAEELAQKIWS